MVQVRKWKGPHTNFVIEQFNAYTEDQESGWNYDAIKPQIEEYYATCLEEDADTPFHKEPRIEADSFVKHFKEKASKYKILRMKDNCHRRVPQDKAANQNEQEAPSPGEKEKG